MTPEQLKESITAILLMKGDDEAAHCMEDELHLQIIKDFCPLWVVEEVERLSATEFHRWCA